MNEPAARTLGDVRRQYGMSLTDLALGMGLPTGDVKILEGRPLDRSSVDLLARYIGALGGKVTVRATLGVDDIVLFDR